MYWNLTDHASSYIAKRESHWTLEEERRIQRERERERERERWKGNRSNREYALLSLWAGGGKREREGGTEFGGGAKNGDTRLPS
jgi:hypothetical protein